MLTGSLKTARDLDTATLLSNGNVLITGGVGTSGAALASSELYTPASGTFVATGAMNQARSAFAAALLK